MRDWEGEAEAEAESCAVVLLCYNGWMSSSGICLKGRNDMTRLSGMSSLADSTRFRAMVVVEQSSSLSLQSEDVEKCLSYFKQRGICSASFCFCF